MTAKASNHIKPCNIAQSERHNRRDTDYIKSLNPKRLYIRTDLTGRNETYVVPGMEGVSLQQHYDNIRTMVKQKTGRAMQEKDVEFTDKAVKEILTDLQTELMQAKEMQKQDILRLGKSLYQKARKDIHAIIKENKQLRKSNERLMAENTGLKEKISTMDDTAINRLRMLKDEKIKELQTECDRANAHAAKSDDIANREYKRANNAEKQLREMLAVPEIKEKWDSIQRNMKAFWQQVDEWTTSAIKTIRNFASDYEHHDFPQEQGQIVGMGIIAEAFKHNLDATDDRQRMEATHSLLGKVSWTGITSFMSDLTKTRTKQLSEEMNVPKELMDRLFLAAGGRGSVGTGGGGSDNELTNWDGTKKRNGWGV